MEMSLSKLQELVRDREAWHAGITELDTTEQLNWLILNSSMMHSLPKVTNNIEESIDNKWKLPILLIMEVWFEYLI